MAAAASPAPQPRGCKRRGDNDGGGLRAPKVLKVATDFSGMDMPIIALRKMGLVCNHVFASDIAAHSRKLIEHVGAPKIMYSDVRARTVNDMPKSDVYIWGAPCQPFSTCGNGEGEGDRRGRGLLAVTSLRYIKEHKPRLTIMENVRGLTNRHRATFDKIKMAMVRYGYRVEARVLNTRQHGVPQQRERIYIVGIRKDSVKRPFVWPEPVPLRYTAKEALLPFNPSTDQVTRLPDKGGLNNRSRELVKQCYKSYLGNNVDPRRNVIFTDVDCSFRFSSSALDYLPCMTAMRGSTCGWWVSVRGRRVALAELFRFQGLEESDVDWQASGVSAKQMGHMLGNSMSLNVCERVLGRALWSAGLVARKPCDRWEAPLVGGSSAAA